MRLVKFLLIPILFILIGFVYIKFTKSGKIGSFPVTQNTPSGVPRPNGFPFLDLPLDYFSKKDVQWGSIKENTTDNSKITNYTQVALNDTAIYQSYPTTTTTIVKYSNEIKLLKTKTYDEILQEMNKSKGWFNETVVQDNYQKYGSLATNYLPSNDIWTLDKFDVDNDGLPEIIVSYNGTWYADGGSYHSDIIKGNNIIFSVTEDNSSIVPADTPNGFYVDWVNNTEFPDSRCCQQGFIRTRFTLKDGQFVPVYEQVVRYLKIGREYQLNQ